MPEHLLSVLIEDDIFNAALNIFYSPQILAERVEEFLKQIDSVPADLEYEPEVSAQMGKVIESATFSRRNPKTKRIMGCLFVERLSL